VKTPDQQTLKRGGILGPAGQDLDYQARAEDGGVHQLVISRQNIVAGDAAQASKNITLKRQLVPKEIAARPSGTQSTTIFQTPKSSISTKVIQVSNSSMGGGNGNGGGNTPN
jgi:hypothetical protein